LVSGGIGWLEGSVCNVSRTKVSRYALDIERSSGSSALVTWQFEANEATGSNGPRLRVKYKVPYSSCLDGEITVGTSCTNCGLATFSVNSTGTAAQITKDEPSSGSLCTHAQQFALVFDTEDLVDAHDITTAKLTFDIQSDGGINYSTKKIGVYSRSSSTACGSITLGQSDFKGCGSLTSLGSITITSNGSSTFTISSPESNINQGGRTVLVLVDETTLTDPEGSSHYFNISTTDHSTSSLRPKLEIEYN
jgi:hypothetical protein